MQKTNYHMHTKRCMHASKSDEEYVISAIKNGYTEIGFSDHTPWKYNSNYVANMRMPLSQFDEYYASISKLKEKYKDQINIKIGLECEYFPAYMPWLKQFLIEKEVDYIIFGNHYYKSDENRVYFGTACESEDMMVAYVDEAIAGMQTGLYSYLCHPDLFMRGRRVFDDVAKRESIRLCESAKQYAIPLEYNLAGAQYNDVMDTMQYPHTEFWKIAATIGNEAIIGVDAHEPYAMEHDTYRKAGITLLESLGIKIIDSLEWKDFTKL
ncbi:MAG: histidinol-phosphatase [Longicatena sp.]